MNSHIVETESFHDNYIHAIALTDENFSSEFDLDIDHIKEWDCAETPCKFVISPATLSFKNINSLIISINRTGFTMNSYLGCILEIKLTHLQNSRAMYEIFMVNDDFIKFEAESSTLKHRGSDIKTTAQYLSKSVRLTSNSSFIQDA